MIRDVRPDPIIRGTQTVEEFREHRAAMRRLYPERLRPYKPKAKPKILDYQQDTDKTFTMRSRTEDDFDKYLQKVYSE